jgi:hypothetical protein
MTTHLGRNPFQKKSATPERDDPKSPPSKSEAKPSSRRTSRGSNSLLVRLPAESFLLALKTVLLVKGVFEKDR